ncbi:MAG: alpha/beta hydrolase [Rhizobiaceae bacterium]|nr:alpha/beta hydrolase [Rhizobiaceae bacterium]MCV0404597.1 alpha/beta hydrolase [Rhizobiaceae bacterium]
MVARVISDWDDAYANGAHIVGSAGYPERWGEEARNFRDRMTAAGRADLDRSYGDGTRNRFDLFTPDHPSRGLFVFVHGGYWMRFDKAIWSHLAHGPLAHGWTVVMPSYTLCPDIRIGAIVLEIGTAVSRAAAAVDGPIVLAGHSAGGHLVTRMACRTAPLADDVQARIVHVLSISGVHDLRPLMRTAMNETLGLTEQEARAESPALLEPADGTRLTCWAGAAERGEFVRQNALLANIWTGLGAATEVVEEADRHHFDVVEALGDPDSAMVRSVAA